MNTPAPANRQELQDKALLLENLLSAALACLDDPNRRSLRVTLLDAAHDLAQELNHGLDSVSLHASAEPSRAKLEGCAA